MPVDWDKALTTFVDKFKAIQEEHGQESVAFLSTGQIPSEEMTFLGTLAKFGMGMKHGDGNTRQCMATAVVAYKQSFGFDAPPYTYKDFEEVRHDIKNALTAKERTRLKDRWIARLKETNYVVIYN